MNERVRRNSGADKSSKQENSVEIPEFVPPAIALRPLIALANKVGKEIIGLRIDEARKYVQGFDGLYIEVAPDNHGRPSAELLRYGRVGVRLRNGVVVAAGAG